MARTIERSIRNALFRIKDGHYDSKLISSLGTSLEGRDYICFSRVKGISSAIEKFNRKRYRSIDQFDDFLGVMIILPDDIELYEVVRIIKSNFEVLHEEDYIQNPKPYGYQSYHIVILFHGIKTEIQMKTRQQKKASDLTHGVYKSEDENKFDTLKDLFKQVL